MFGTDLLVGLSPSPRLSYAIGGLLLGRRPFLGLFFDLRFIRLIIIIIIFTLERLSSLLPRRGVPLQLLLLVSIASEARLEVVARPGRLTESFWARPRLWVAGRGRGRGRGRKGPWFSAALLREAIAPSLLFVFPILVSFAPLKKSHSGFCQQNYSLRLQKRAKPKLGAERSSKNLIDGLNWLKSHSKQLLTK